MSLSTRHLTLFVFVLASAIVQVSQAQAALSYLSIPSIVGEDPTPGYPGAMAAQSVTVVPDGFSIVKNVDAASPDIFGAVVAGTPLGTSSLLLYNASPSGPPDAKLLFPNVLASGYQLLGGGGTPTERDSFSATTPAAMYLELPGITRESSTPGHPGVMQIQSFALTANAFSVVKQVDSASPDIFFAVVAGTHFSTGSILFYDSLVPASKPAATFVFHTLLASAYQPLGGGNTPLEQDTFNFVSVTQPIPEPAAMAILTVGSLLIGCAHRRPGMLRCRRAAVSSNHRLDTARRVTFPAVPAPVTEPFQNSSMRRRLAQLRRAVNSSPRPA